MPAQPPPFDTVFRAERAVIDGAVSAVEIGVRRGEVGAIASLGSGLPGRRVVTLADDEVLLPGLVDSHVHVNEPGRTEWEGFATATRAAAAGGVTTIVDMPLNSIPPTVDVAALAAKRRAADGQLAVDVGFWGGVVPGNLGEIEPLIADGVFGFKCFLADSGVPEFPPLDADGMEAAMRVIAANDSLLLVHAEDARILGSAHYDGGTDYAGFLASRPGAAENTAIHEVIERARRSGARAHVLHLSSAASLTQIAEARADGVDLSVETCPHYLCLTAEEIPAGATAFKCCPPIRDAANREQLWGGLADGTIDFIASDHSPSTPELKNRGGGDFGQAWGGIASLQLGLPLVWTEARRRGIPLTRVVEWMAAAPARRVGLHGKGRIVAGGAADFAVFAPEASFTVDAARLEHRHPVSVYDGRQLFGVVRAAYLAGRLIERDEPRGRMLRRAAAPRTLQPGGRSGHGMPIGDFNAAVRGSAIELLHPCIGVPRWVEELVDGRPYADRAALLARAATAAEPFTPDEVTAALSRHPRIGERPAGPGGEAALSRREQHGVASADAALVEAIRLGNLAYEQRFGQVFLIRAAGRSAGDILEQLTGRLGNTPEQEDPIVAQQLREIALLRLSGIIDEGAVTP